MDPRKWVPSLPLFRTLTCIYCGGAADTSDHTPPRCLLPRTLPRELLIMTVPACSRCNGGFSRDEMRVAAIVCTVSFSDADKIAVAPGGWVHRAMEKDHELRTFILSRLDGNGLFHIDNPVLDAISRVM